MQIISADERLAERRGVKALIVGPSGVGKTSQLRSLLNGADALLFADCEAGDLAIRDCAVDAVRIESWSEASSLATTVANGGLAQYRTLFFDSLTAVGRLSLKHAEVQPECVSRSGIKDTRAVYGLHARQLLDWIHIMQHAPAMNVILVAILETVKDDFGRTEHRIQLDGEKAGRELVGIIDEIVTYQILDFADGRPPTRGFVCTSPNIWAYPAKDRSGRLDQIEPPNLGRLLDKLNNKRKENQP
jgi:hypothetical protein